MNPLKIISGAIVAFGLTGQAQAQTVSFDGATVSAFYDANFFDGAFGYAQYGLEGSVVVGFGGPISVQADIMYWTYDDNTTANMSYGGHIIYVVAPNLTFGAFYTLNDWDSPRDWQVYGIEALFNPAFMGGAFQFEAVLAGFQLIGAVDVATLMGLNAVYAVNSNIELSGGILIGYWDEFGNPDDLYGNIILAATYSFDSGVFVTASYNKRIYTGAAADDWNVFGVAVGFNYGNGAIFSQRSYPSFYPGD